MSDTTDLNIYVRSADLHWVEKTIGTVCYQVNERIPPPYSHAKELGESGVEWTELYDEQANYGGVEDLDALRTAGIPFMAFHGPGDNYGPMLFAFDGKDHAEVDCIEGDPAVRVLRTGTITVEYRNARSYWQIVDNLIRQDGNTP